MKLSLTTKFDVDDRVWFDGQGPDDTGTVTKVVVTRDPGTELLKVEYLVNWDHGVNPGDELDTFEAHTLHRV